MFARRGTALAAAAILLAACGGSSGEPADEEPTASPLPSATVGPASGTWKAIADGPLSPRQMADAVWTGKEVLVYGGHDLRCEESACYPEPDDIRKDAAAYDPARDSWRTIAPIPVRTLFPQSAVVGDAVYVRATPRLPEDAEPQPASWLTYSIADDEWDEIASPDGEVVPIAVGDRLVAADVVRDKYTLYDAKADSWTALPASPLGPTEGQAVGDGSRLYAVSNPPMDSPEIPDRLAVLDLATKQWTRLADSPAKGGGGWRFTGGRLVATYVSEPEHAAASYDPAAKNWSLFPGLPDRPVGQANSVTFLTDHFSGDGIVVASPDYALRVPDMTWSTIRPHEALGGLANSVVVDYPATAWAGDRLFAWGGNQRARGEGADAETHLRDAGWTWTP